MFYTYVPKNFYSPISVINSNLLITVSQCLLIKFNNQMISVHLFCVPILYIHLVKLQLNLFLPTYFMFSTCPSLSVFSLSPLIFH